MSEYDARQLRAMAHQIDAYKHATIDLPWLIASLEALQSALENVPERWVEHFSSKWGVLEEIYSMAVVREQSIPEAYLAEIAQVLEEIEAMIAAILPAGDESEPADGSL